MSGRFRRELAPLVHALDQIGGTSWPVVGVVVAFPALFRYASDAVAFFLQSRFGETAFYVTAAVAFAAPVAPSMWLVRRHYRPRPVIVERTGLGAHTPILFPSPPASASPKPGDGRREIDCAEAVRRLEACATDPGQLRTIGDPRRMPPESALAHRSTLRRVVVIPAREIESRIDAFRRCAQAFLGDRVEVVDAREFTGAFDRVDFATDLEGRVDLLDAVYAEIGKKGEPADRVVVVDVTGGTEICSLAGLAAVQRLPGRCFQYVFAATGSPARVGIRDVTFELDQRPA